MNRFDKLEMLRFTVEVHVPGFDIRKSIAKANKQKQKRLQEQTRPRPPTPPSTPPPDPTPVVFGSGDSTDDHKEEPPCPPFQMTL